MKTKTKNGYFNKFGGAYVPEMLVHALKEIESEFGKAIKDDKFKKEFTELLHSFSGRPTPLMYAKNLTKYFGGAKLYFKMKVLTILVRTRLLIVSVRL
jgi:tryptophan synthase beta chain